MAEDHDPTRAQREAWYALDPYPSGRTEPQSERAPWIRRVRSIVEHDPDKMAERVQQAESDLRYARNERAETLAALREAVWLYERHINSAGAVNLAAAVSNAALRLVKCHQMVETAAAEVRVRKRDLDAARILQADTRTANEAAAAASAEEVTQ